MKKRDPTYAIEPNMLDAEPEPLAIDLQRFAVAVIDMQNAFVSKGGMFDLRGHDISKGLGIIESIKRISKAARARGCKVIYTVARYSPDFHESGGPNSPSWHRSYTIAMYREHPELRDKLTVRGTWGTEIVDELKPEEGDLVVEKQKYSAFFGTNLDTILKTYDIKYLAFTGVATNICVESTLRDAYYREYFPILITDSCANAGPPATQEATIHNTKLSFGWVTSTENLLKVLLE